MGRRLRLEGRAEADVGLLSAMVGSDLVVGVRRRFIA
jgi:hypothetical protein